MNNQTKTIIAWTLIIAVIIVGGGYYWGSSTIIADSSPPIILESVTTGGDLAYGTGSPKVTLVFTENVGVQSATATLYNVGSLGILGSKIEEITLTQTAKTGTQHQYDGRFTKTLEANREYYIVYRVTDTAGHSDTYGKDTLGRGTVKIKLVQVEATIKVNGIEVKSTSDKIIVDSLTLFFEAEVTTGAQNIDSIYATINTVRVDFTQSGTKYVATYMLPGDGSYTLYVKLLDTGGGQTMLASFSIQLGSEQRTPLIIGTLGALLAGIIWFTMDQNNGPVQKKVAKKKPRSS
jgi:hypothetical protein